MLHLILFFPWNICCTFTSALSTVCVQCTIWLVSVIPRFCTFVLCCSGVVWVILREFKFLLLLPVSLLPPHSTCAELLLYGFCTLESSQLLPYNISTCTNCTIYWHACSLFIITNYAVRFIVRNSSVGLLCRFHSTVTLRSWPVYKIFGTGPYNCLLYNFPPFSYICYSAVQHTLYHVSVCTVLLPILDMPMWWVPLPRQIVYSLHLLSVSVCNIFVARHLNCNAWYCAAIISLPVSLSYLPSTAITTCLLHQ